MARGNKKITAATAKNYDRITKAVFCLLEDKKYEDITVAEICEKAEISRSAFYGNFADKKEFFKFLIWQFFDGFAEKIKSAEISENHIEFTARTVFSAALKNGKIFAELLNYENGKAVTDALTEKIFSIAAKADLSVPPELFSEIVAADIAVFIKWCITDGKNHTPDGAAEYANILFAVPTNRSDICRKAASDIPRSAE